jgi:hypothetical protein
VGEGEAETVTTPYSYVGPEEIRAKAIGCATGTRIASPGDVLAWARRTGQVPGPDGLIAATFVVDAGGDLLVADRRSEHVACAGGGPVLSAGEIFFCIAERGAEAAEVSNQSTGYCPEPESWPAVAAALERAGLGHPGGFTHKVVFRLCPACGERNVVKDGWRVCGVCGGDLPAAWNFPPGSVSWQEGDRPP